MKTNHLLNPLKLSGKPHLNSQETPLKSIKPKHQKRFLCTRSCLKHPILISINLSLKQLNLPSNNHSPGNHLPRDSTRYQKCLFVVISDQSAEGLSNKTKLLKWREEPFTKTMEYLL
jgi:hypothetical protein